MSYATHNAEQIARIRRDFPMLSRMMNAKPLVYLDNAATAQKPAAVIERISRFYREEYATVNRGVYSLSQEVTTACDSVREHARTFFNAADRSEILFTKGTTEAINLVARSAGEKWVRAGDDIIISTIEHHSNIVPWQMLCEHTGATLRVIPVNDRGELLMDVYEKLLSPRTRIVAIGHISNALGTINPIADIIRLAHAQGTMVLVDGAQGAAHAPVDVQALDCDFYCCSGHKLYGPTGIGILYAKRALLNDMPPFLGGGDMIESVTVEKTTFAQPPARFEAGTPAIAEILGLGAALEYIASVGFDTIIAQEELLLQHATEQLSAIPGLRIVGTAAQKASLISFVLDGVHPHDIGTILDQHGIAIRAGHHCAQPTMRRFGVPATARASFSFYNTMEEVTQLADALQKVREVFG